jgi:galactose mutarotase-like enzyme
LIRYAALEGEQSEDKVTFRLTSDEETRAQYPFDFVYEISYRLEGKKVLISYRIENTGSKDMPFTFGLHPAFRIDGDFSDWTLKLSPAGTASQIHFNKGSVSQEEVCLDTWQLSRKDIEEEATLVYADVKADKAVLLKGGKPVLAMHFKGFPYLAIWTHDVPSHFLCIEPWYGHADFEPVDVPFEKRAGMMELAPGEVWTTGYEIEVL